MRILVWLLRIALFLILLSFAIKNDGVVTVRVFFGEEWQVPLVVVMLIMFAGGVLLGATATVATLFSQRSEIKRLQRANNPPLSAQTRLRNMGADAPDSF